MGGAARAHAERRASRRVAMKSIVVVVVVVVVRTKWEMESEVDERRKGEKGEMTVHIYSHL
jgi:hypothetical protein